MWNDASRPFGFVRVDASDGLPEHAEIEVTSKVSFPQGQFFSGLDVIPTLTNASHAVLEALKALEGLAIDNGLYERSIFPPDNQ